MPSISRFFGITIYLYPGDHNPPHFHAIYNDQEALISIDDLKILMGSMKPRVLGLVIERAKLHQQELLNNRNRMTMFQELKQIKPLE